MTPKDHRTGIFCVFAAAALAALLVLSAASQPGNVAHAGAWVDRSTLEATHTDAGLEVRCEVTNPLGHEVTKQLEVTVTDLDGKVIMRTPKTLVLSPGANTYSTVLSGDLPGDAVPASVLKYRFGDAGGYEEGARSLVHALSQLETRVVAYRDLLSGSTAGIRLVALNHATSMPVDGASVVMKLASGGEEHVLFTGLTGPDGSIEAQFRVPDELEGDAELRIVVAAKGLGEDTIVQSVSVRRKAKILLTTDKPLYLSLIHI